jgi:hypothetical protein
MVAAGISTPFSLKYISSIALPRWADTVPDQEEQIVTALLRDATLAAFHSAVGHSLPEGSDRIILNWLPDPTTLLHIPRVRKHA